MADKPPPPPMKAPPPPPMKAPPPPPKKAPPPPPKKAPPPPPKKAPPPPPKKPKPPKPPMSEADIKKAIEKAVSDEDYELAARLKSQLNETAPPPKVAPPPKKAEKPLPKKRPAKGAPKGRPKGKPKGKPKKGRRIKINLRLRQKAISDEDDSYTDQVGWTVSHDDYEEPEAPVNKEPEAIMHQCSMCGSMMRIPKPTRDRYTVICAHPECGHEDSIGV